MATDTDPWATMQRLLLASRIAEPGHEGRIDLEIVRVIGEIGEMQEPRISDELRTLAEAVVASQPGEQTPEEMAEWAKRLAAGIVGQSAPIWTCVVCGQVHPADHEGMFCAHGMRCCSCEQGTCPRCAGLLTPADIDRIQRIGRDEESRRTTIGLVEFDELCETARWALRELGLVRHGLIGVLEYRLDAVSKDRAKYRRLTRELRAEVRRLTAGPRTRRKR